MLFRLVIDTRISVATSDCLTYVMLQAVTLIRYPGLTAHLKAKPAVPTESIQAQS